MDIVKSHFTEGNCCIKVHLTRPRGMRNNRSYLQRLLFKKSNMVGKRIKERRSEVKIDMQVAATMEGFFRDAHVIYDKADNRLYVHKVLTALTIAEVEEYGSNY